MVLATCTVSENSDAGGSNTLRAHIANTSCDRVEFAANVGTIQLVNQIIISRSVSILGNRPVMGTNPIIIRAKQHNASTAGDGSRIFKISDGTPGSPIHVLIAGVVLENGDPSDDIPPHHLVGTSAGAAVFMGVSSELSLPEDGIDGSLTISDSIIRSNSSGAAVAAVDGGTSGDIKLKIQRTEISDNSPQGNATDGGGLRFYGGTGGAWNSDPPDPLRTVQVEIIDSTFANNVIKPISGSGGALGVGASIVTGYGGYGEIKINNSTFSGNQTVLPSTAPDTASGAGLVVQITSGTLKLDSLTITKNKGGGFAVPVGLPIQITNSIVAANTTSKTTLPLDISSPTNLVTGGFNMVGSGGSGGLNAATNKIGAQYDDPKLDSLKRLAFYVERRIDPIVPTHNTRVHDPLSTSSAVNMGSTDLESDQRGAPRTSTDDIGAVERRLNALLCDLNEDGVVDAADLGLMFGAWGQGGAGDLNHDGTIDAADAGICFSEWTPSDAIVIKSRANRIRDAVLATFPRV